MDARPMLEPYRETGARMGLCNLQPMGSRRRLSGKSRAGAWVMGKEQRAVAFGQTIPRSSASIRAFPSGRVADLVRELAPEYRLEPTLVLAVIEAESDFNPFAQSHAGARGLMQLLPQTADRFGVADIWDPEENLRGGMAYLRWLLDYFDRDIELALAAYNAGEQAVIRHGGIPPYDETRAYVSRIAARLGL